MKIVRRVVVPVLLAFPLLGLAQSQPSGMDSRQAGQERRIDAGVESGALSPVEAARVEKNRQNIERLEAKAKADGKLTPRERARIQKSENIQSRRIYAQKHDQHHDDLPGDGKKHRHYTRRQ